MASFDIVSEVDIHELTNAVDQANRELEKRFDFKGSNARFELEDAVITLSAPNEFQLQQMMDILRGRLVARKIDPRCMDIQDPSTNVAEARQQVTIKQGIEQPVAKRIVADVKGGKFKVSTQIQGDKLRVEGKKRDDLQTVIAFLREQEYEVPLQFDNFRS